MLQCQLEDLQGSLSGLKKQLDQAEDHLAEKVKEVSRLEAERARARRAADEHKRRAAETEQGREKKRKE